MSGLLSKRNIAVLLLPVLVIISAVLPLISAAPAVAGSVPSQVIISSVDISPRQVAAGEDFQAIVTLRNVGVSPASAVRLSINEGAVNSPFAPYLTPGTIVIAGQLAPGAQTQEIFRLGSSSGAAPGINNLFLTVRHQTVADGVNQQNHISTETIGIPIKASPPREVDKPRLVVSRVELEPGSVEAGQGFSLRLNINNVGKEKAQAIRAAVSRVEGAAGLDVFSPVGASNTFTLDELQSGQQRQIALPFTVSPHARAKIYNLVLEMDYRDRKGQTYTASEVISIPVHRGGRMFLADTGPKLILQGQRSSRTPVPAGESFDLSLDIFNAAEFNARNIKITVSEEQPGRLRTFSPVKTGNVVFIPELASKERVTSTFPLAAAKRAASGRYNLIIEMNYEDAAGNRYESAGTASVLVKGAESGPKLLLQGQRSSRTPVPAGESFDLSLDIFNAAEFNARNIKITVSEEQPGRLRTFSPVKTGNVVFIPELASKERVTRNFSLAAGKGAASGRYNLIIEMNYEDAAGNRYESTGTASVLVKGAEQIWGPELTIAAHVLSVEQVEAGSPFLLTLKVRNIGDKMARNAKVSLAHLEGADTLTPFSPLQGSNTLYIERLAAGETVARSIDLFVSGEARSKSYNLVLNFSYQGGGTERTASEIIGIPVSEGRRLKIVTFNYPKKVMPGEEFSIYAEYVNIGQHPMTNLFVTFEGDFTVDYPLYYLGKFETGSTDTFEVKAAIAEPGEYRGRVTFSYTDNFNQERVVSKPVTISVEEPSAPAVKEPSAEQENGFWAWLKRFLLAVFGLGS